MSLRDMKPIILSTIVGWTLLAIAATILVFSVPSHAQSFQLTCPIGTSNVNPVSPTVNQTNNKYIQWLCSDPFGNITLQNVTVSASTFPGATFPTGSVTVNPSLLVTGGTGTVVVSNNIASIPAAPYSAIFANSSGSALWTVSSNPTPSGSNGIASPIPILQVNGATATFPIQNFNATTPAAPANGINLTWNRTGASISAAVVGDGVATDCLIGTGVFSSCPGPGGLKLSGANCSGTTTTCTTPINGSPSAFVATPSCTATSITAGITSFYLSAVSATSATVTYTPSQSASFNIVCTGI